MMMRLVLLLMVSITPFQVQAEDHTCEPWPVERVQNRDGSALTIAAECPGSNLRRYTIDLYCADNQHCDRLQGEHHTGAPTGDGAAFVDLDDDGMYEVEIIGACGAGPDCASDIYRTDEAATGLVHFFSGSRAELLLRDGWLLASGRINCCAWQFHAWKLDAPHTLPLQYDNMDMTVDVGTPFGEGEFDCVFLQRHGDDWRKVAPPSPSLETLCAVYGGDYRLAPPDKKLDAMARPQEQ